MFDLAGLDDLEDVVNTCVCRDPRAGATGGTAE